MINQEISKKKKEVPEDILIIEENTIYEIDMNCMECKKEKERQKSRMERKQRK